MDGSARVLPVDGRSALPSGSIPALATPLHADGSLDWESFRSLIDWHIEEGTDALVVMGSTGEAATMTMDEHMAVIRAAVVHAAGRIPIIGGVGSNATAAAIELAEAAKEAGVDAALSVVPYYNKPTQDGLYAHFRAIAEAVDLPFILYNVPGRTITDLADETVLRLAEIPNIAGLKDATGDIGRGIALLRRVPETFVIYSGDDETAAALMLHGAHGNISVTANVIPATMRRLCAAARIGDAATVRWISRVIAPLNKALFVESNPIPVKWALGELGRLSPHHRLPLTPLSIANRAHVGAALRLAIEGMEEEALDYVV
ncbi:4-hydroxy-tetrahydrodipicolinate synthase [Sphingobium chungbukense]|uniref:4-hydroxy-tetrahydrodipicolinate synthase n=1 Tax=Sphingobium chungbukense TaxID=56193 RepID=A0A0M3AKE0_9SPHN|nr:4-hydroxy-tetrahydrodipicolinate synthase [Sphingobium chungbukense]KKW90428.1 dihydrodipicolinate synthase [Sphingobium chungbukense]